MNFIALHLNRIEQRTRGREFLVFFNSGDYRLPTVTDSTVKLRENEKGNCYVYVNWKCHVKFSGNHILKY